MLNTFIATALMLCQSSQDRFHDMILKGKFAEAISYADNNMNPVEKNSLVWKDLGTAYEEMNFKEKALACYLVALRMDQNQEGAYIGTARIYNKLGRYENALIMAKKGLNSWNSCELNREYAYACMKIKKKDECIKEYEFAKNCEQNSSYISSIAEVSKKEAIGIQHDNKSYMKEMNEEEKGRNSAISTINSIKQNVAIIGIDNINISKENIMILTSRLRAEVFNTNRYIVLERDKMNEILKEQGFQQTGCTTSECLIQVGQLLNVEKMIGGSIGRIGNMYSIELRLIDVATGKISAVATTDVDGEIDEVLKNGLSNAVNKLIIK